MAVHGLLTVRIISGAVPCKKRYCIINADSNPGGYVKDSLNFDVLTLDTPI